MALVFPRTCSKQGFILLLGTGRIQTDLFLLFFPLVRGLILVDDISFLAIMRKLAISARGEYYYVCYPPASCRQPLSPVSTPDPCKSH